MSERWRDIPDFEGRYEISDLGRLRSKERVNRFVGRWGKVIERPIKSKILKQQTIARTGHRYVIIIPNDADQSRILYIHQAVLQAFVGPRPPGLEGCHDDGNPANNHLDNLRWDTHASNIADKKHHGTAPIGEKNPAAKLTSAQVVEIRRRLSVETQSELAREYRVSVTTIWHIKHGRKWANILA